MVLLPRHGALNPIAPFGLHRRPFVPLSNLKGIFAGSGNASMSHPFLAKSVVDLTGMPPKDVSLLYLGTATYDIEKFRIKQTTSFAKLGCQINMLNVALDSHSTFDIAKAVQKANVIMVSGGNTLYAIDRWKQVGLDELLRDAAHSGTVMAGGSAGAICWFDGGHSDSMDPETYRLPMLDRHVYDFDSGEPNEISNPQDGQIEGWEYIRVEGLGILPGLVCPHYDQTQSNGILRMDDFDSMMGRHSAELGIGIDHHAALEINGDDFRILSIPGEKGSVPQSLEGEERSSTTAGVWVKYVDDNGNVCSKVCPAFGKVEELLQCIENPGENIKLDDRVELCRKQNPSHTM